MKNLFLSLICFFGLISANKAQLTIDSLSTYQSISNDTVPLGSNLIFSANIVYIDTTPFTGTVYLLCGIDSSGGLISVDTVGSLFVTNATLNDSIIIFANDTVLQQNGYRIGGNIVVVWPIANGLLTLDTFSALIYVTPLLTSINENKVLHNQFSIYPNPTHNFITIKNSSPNKTVKHVRIFGIDGSLQYQSNYTSNIDITNFSTGIYFLELELDSNEVLTYKILKK
ncbi:MAG: hypothetical protein CVT95_03825 [Bacteroidetes bacterium HGW-Bacteroidetes-12]|nr:MAG: hypothetical protein CVT95_03825 [Bacteroidetes bacterium HGW-Bacteroidetes-12]